jgi:hypothetical protein
MRGDSAPAATDTPPSEIEGGAQQTEAAADVADTTTAPATEVQAETAETTPREQTQPRQNAQDQALSAIEQLIEDGRVRTALERLDVMREEDITNDRVNNLIESAVRAEVSELTSSGDYDAAIARLTNHINSRPYLEHMDADLKTVYLARLEAAIEEDDYVPVTQLAQINSVFPRDAEVLYRANLLMADAGYLAQALPGFSEVLSIDDSYRSREPILTFARSMLRNGWISNINNSARELVGRHYIEEFRPELIDNLSGEEDNVRLNSLQILRRFSRDDLATIDLFEFHRLNMERIDNYRNRGQPFGWAVDFFLEQTDSTRIRLAIDALEIVLAADSVQGASGLLRDCREAIDSLRSLLPGS